jgi:hypothetical protein
MKGRGNLKTQTPGTKENSNLKLQDGRAMFGGVF